MKRASKDQDFAQSETDILLLNDMQQFPRVPSGNWKENYFRTKKTMNRLMSFALLSLLLLGGAFQKAQAQDVSVSYQEFYDNLAPYGQWVTDPQYGNVWVPNEGGDFRPYGSRGHWVMTDYGNTWVSEDPWGWACYHYGRWTYDNYYGWVWIPGYEWAPAWVSWRFGGGYSGWAPLGPGAGLAYDCPISWWVFVEPQYMYENDCYHHWRGPSYNNTYYHQTTIINNYYNDNSTHVRYNYGPRPEAVRQYTHRDITVYHVSQTNRPGAPGISGNRVSMYRPAINRSTISSARPAAAIAAPRAIGRPQAQTNVSAAARPAFRQEIQNHPPANNGGNRQAPNVQQPAARPQERPQPEQRPQPQERPQPQQRTEPQQRPQPEQRPQPQERPQPQQRPEPQQRPQPEQRPQPQERPQPQQRPQPQERPMPQQRPQPQERPMPQQRPQPQERPMPQQRPQPQQQPMPQQRPQPMPQQQQRPMPQAPHNEAPHEGGRR